MGNNSKTVAANTVLVHNSTKHPIRVPLFDNVQNASGETVYDKTAEFWLMIGPNAVQSDLWGRAMESKVIRGLLESGQLAIRAAS